VTTLSTGPRNKDKNTRAATASMLGGMRTGHLYPTNSINVERWSVSLVAGLVYGPLYADLP